jgi:S1-C subfamily serine protease
VALSLLGPIVAGLSLGAASGLARPAPPERADDAALPTDGRAREAVFERFKPSIVTVEVRPVGGEARSALGSGYIVGRHRIVTNYHVVGSYVHEPARYRLQVKTGSETQEASLVAFDLVNDLALLEASVDAPALRLAAQPGGRGAPILAFGNPEGLGMSLVEGVFNGFAEKGFVDRMLLSMPLHQGMSGGPILNARHEVVGTNVATSWRSNVLSFGVPVTAVHALLAAPRIETSPEVLRVETHRQLAALEVKARDRAVTPMLAGVGGLTSVGGAQTPRPPDAFECWTYTETEEQNGVGKNSYQCNLQFTPAIEDVGEVASFEILVEHLTSPSSSYGFYGGLSGHAANHHGVGPRAPDNGTISAPHCRNDRVKTAHLVWNVSTCSYAYVRHPDLGHFALVATSESRPHEAVFVALHGRGVGLEVFARLSESVLAETRFAEAQP